jgi:rhodanese-related sulfurtransferase
MQSTLDNPSSGKRAMRKSKTIFATLLLMTAALLLPSLGYGADFPPSVGQRVAETKKAIKTVDMAGFKAMYDKKAYGLLVDVRDPDEYAAANIPGSVNVSRGKLEFTIWKHVGGPENPDYNKKMTLHCATGGRCALAAKTLMDLGFKDVTSVDMKLADWQKAGYPLQAKK